LKKQITCGDDRQKSKNRSDCVRKSDE